MELLTILYAMLAALTGVSVCEATCARQPQVVTVEAQAAQAAVSVLSTIAKVPAAHAHLAALPWAWRSSIAGASASAAQPMLPALWIVLARRHL